MPYLRINNKNKLTANGLIGNLAYLGVKTATKLRWGRGRRPTTSEASSKDPQLLPAQRLCLPIVNHGNFLSHLKNSSNSKIFTFKTFYFKLFNHAILPLVELTIYRCMGAGMHTDPLLFCLPLLCKNGLAFRFKAFLRGRDRSRISASAS